MAAAVHWTHVYLGLAGEGDYIGEGGLLRKADGEGEWQDISAGLPENPQVRALLLSRDDPQRVFAGTQDGVYRSNDRGQTWEALNDPSEGREVWSLAAHPQRSRRCLCRLRALRHRPVAGRRQHLGGDERQRGHLSPHHHLHAAAGQAGHRNRHRPRRPGQHVRGH